MELSNSHTAGPVKEKSVVGFPRCRFLYQYMGPVSTADRYFPSRYQYICQSTVVRMRQVSLFILIVAFLETISGRAVFPEPYLRIGSQNHAFDLVTTIETPATNSTASVHLNSTLLNVTRRDPVPPQLQLKPFPWDRKGPLMHHFPDDLEDRARSSYIEMLQLSMAALWSLDRMPAVVGRYFKPEDWGTVRSVYQALLGPTNKGSPLINDAEHHLDFIYEDATRYPQGPCARNPLEHGWQGPSLDGDFASPRDVLSICPNMFTKYPKGLTAWDCNQAPASISYSYYTIGALMLHEVTH